MLELIQPYLSDVVEILLSIVLILITGALVELRRRTLKWIESRTNKEQRELLHRLAEEAFSFAETAYKELDGPRKYDQAVYYFSNRLQDYGIELSGSEIKSAIEKVVLEYNSKVKGKTN
jgi:hypothetical protein